MTIQVNRNALLITLSLLVTVCTYGHVDLVTIPTRESVQLTIYNSVDLTMVREHRLLTVKKGVNRIQFSWANTLIDSTSIDFRILDHIDKVDLLDTTFPSGRNDALQWNVSSEIDGKVPVEIRYFTSGITWKADYAGIAKANQHRSLRVAGKVARDLNIPQLISITPAGSLHPETPIRSFEGASIRECAAKTRVRDSSAACMPK